MRNPPGAAAVVGLLAGLALAAAACKAEVDIADGGGGSSSTTTKSATGKTSTGTGAAGCTSHDDCPGGVCVFDTGACSKSCDFTNYCAGGCDAGTTCEGCATSSCPLCKDCTAACVPISPKRCDENNPCDKGDVCVWQTHECAPPCTLNGGCDDPSRVCMECVAGSCCACQDCVSACVHPIK